MTRQWAETDLHFAKRNLSVREKQTIPETSGKALVLPGAINTEIEELVEVGFDPCLIYGIEVDPLVAEILYDHYYDQSPIHLEEVGDFLSRATSKFCYIHLDYCGQITESTIDSMEKAMGSLDPIARLRVSVFGSRRTKTTKRFESEIIDATLLNILDHIGGAEDLREHLASGLKEPDPACVVAMVAFVNHVIGLSWHGLCDQLTTNDDLLIARGTHQVSDVRRYRYTSDSNVMYTMWIDFIPAPCEAISRTPQYLVSQVFHFARILIDPTPDYVMLGSTN